MDTYHIPTFKIVLLGETNVGKSALLNRYFADEFKEVVKPTVGLDWLDKVIETDGLKIKLQIWDTPGLETHRGLIDIILKGADGFVFVYDITKKGTFKMINSWYQMVEPFIDAFSVSGLLGNKEDLSNQRAVKATEGEKFAQKYSMTFSEVSAFTGANVNEFIDKLYKLILMKRRSDTAESDGDDLGFGLSLKYTTVEREGRFVKVKEDADADEEESEDISEYDGIGESDAFYDNEEEDIEKDKSLKDDDNNESTFIENCLVEKKKHSAKELKEKRVILRVDDVNVTLHDDPSYFRTFTAVITDSSIDLVPKAQPLSIPSPSSVLIDLQHSIPFHSIISIRLVKRFFRKSFISIDFKEKEVKSCVSRGIVLSRKIGGLEELYQPIEASWQNFKRRKEYGRRRREFKEKKKNDEITSKDSKC
ncbi:Rab, unspecified Rab-like protein [Monocercomonoides exilis]|uniref:Rab, unspecified Rab-like protein n=1 Tax=Monocercomonoides exilis TaxID=2049356 RepID=UPI003559D39C|nr:Rab, unspecified Rab-like protein [Monocercomonoides exilis]|eukprot:MONOS_7401.1-p1 / transcript=MONOS_7401.1 / gene=MONOS_7401 / organism=Monocercomonoides_exilis_PA203 / gene_product=Rab, unspecified Rab-like protein / transcript_product=Rab, unspecified Rab-like protein / location=Mono_scaffold00251:76850-78750(+) / protein_length=421 / sequence_SO=supercontig / SO=protein_coding / is_pseudo=false